MNEIEETKKAEEMELRSKEDRQLQNQQELKEYLNTFYQGVYSTRMLIQLHVQISNAVQTGRLQNTQFWGCMQNNVYVSSVVGNMFAIFDDNSKHIFKSFIKFLRTITVYNITDDDIKRWLKTLEPYEGYRNCKIAHLSLKLPFIPSVDYKQFHTILDEFEKKLIEIHNKCIIHHTIKNGIWNSSIVDPESELLQDLRKILFLSSASESIS